MSVRFIMLLIAASCTLGVNSESQGQRPTRTFVWPLSRSMKPDAPLLATFGPRVESNGPDSYSFHRGIDIPTKEGSPVYAVADGVVRLAGSYDNYRSPVVQLRHYKNGSRSAKDGGSFYTNYMHLSEATVVEGKAVKQGDLLGYTGTSAEGIPHLHFEVRNGGVWQQNCVHPLTLLPYQNRLGPKIQVDALKSTDAGLGALTLTLTSARNECDLAGVQVAIFDSGRKKVDRVYDMVALNFANTPQEDPNSRIHVQDFQNVLVQPRPLDAEHDYELTLTFYDLPGIKVDKSYQIKARAIDARGKSSDFSARVRAEHKDADDNQVNGLAAKLSLR